MRKAIPNEGYNKSAVALIGHGTPKDEESSEAIYHLAGQIRRQSRFSNVKCFFLDEEPLIEGLADAFETDDIHIFPIFIGEGLHTQIDIPERLGFAHERPVYGTHLIQDSECTLNYHPPLGVLPESTDIIMQRLIESGATITSQGSADSQDTRTYLRPAAQFFLELLNSRTSEKSLWGELVISADGDDTFEIRHTDDEPASSNLLKTHTVDDAWHIAKWDLHGDYRPLKSRPGLQSGWIIRQLSASELIQALDYFYPASIDSVYRSKQGQLNMTQFKHIASRQSGLYRKTRQITRDELRILVERCCHANACLKSNLWFEPERHKNTGSERLLCSAPCAVLMDETRTIAMQTHSKKFYKEQLQ
jgi:sirohydrochlorin cobaltochelatase